MTHAEIDALARRGMAPGDTAHCIELARTGRLWRVDTGSRGADQIVDAVSASDALDIVARHEEPEIATAHDDDAVGWAQGRGWRADRVEAT